MNYTEEPAFELGRAVTTCGVVAAIKKNPDLEQQIARFLRRHHLGDGGDLDADDKVTNFEAIMKGGRIISSYNTPDAPDGKIRVITEADRSVTTILLPSEH